MSRTSHFFVLLPSVSPWFLVLRRVIGEFHHGGTERAEGEKGTSVCVYDLLGICFLPD